MSIYLLINEFIYNDTQCTSKLTQSSPWYNLSSRMSAGLKRKAPTDSEPSTFERELELINHRHGLRKRAIELFRLDDCIICTVLGKSRDAWARPELKPLNPREQSLGNRVLLEF